MRILCHKSKELLELRNEIQALKQERQGYRKSYQDIASNISKMLYDFNSDDDDSMTNWATLSSTIVGDIYHVNDKVCFVPVTVTEEKLVFVTVVQENGAFGVHKHDVDEYCKVLMGQLIEPLDGFKVIEVGECYKYPAFKRHSPKGGESLNIYWVTFKKE